MDITMPGPDGIAVTRRLTAAYPDAKVVILTDHDEASYRQAASDAGAQGYVLKGDLSDLTKLLVGEAGPWPLPSQDA
jgi:two-component system response regulator DegU